MIITPKGEKPRPAQINFRWDPDVITRLKRIADRTGHSINEAGELLMKWALGRAEVELEISGDEAAPLKRKKQ